MLRKEDSAPDSGCSISASLGLQPWPALQLLDLPAPQLHEPIPENKSPPLLHVCTLLVVSLEDPD